jgi:hypothetical protein
MKVVKVLEQKIVIQLFGLSLILAPFLNILFNLNDLNGLSFDLFFHYFWAGVLFQKVLNIGSIAIGGFLLTGSLQAWKLVLLLLGGYIAMQMTYLGQNMRSQPMSLIFFLVNIGLFLFIADQLVWKQKTAKPMAIQKPVPRIRKMLLHMEGGGAWAELRELSNHGVQVKCLGPAPGDLRGKEIEMLLPGGAVLRSRLKHINGTNYYFEYLPAQKEQTEILTRWMQQKAG